MSSEIYYSTIDELPLYNWIKCTESEDKTFVRRGKKGSVREDLLKWEIIYDEYIKTYGLSKYYKRVLAQYRKKAEAELNNVLKDDKFQLTLIEMETQKLERILNNGGKGVTIEQTLIHLSKWIGYWIKVKEISVKEFFDLSKEFTRTNKTSVKDGSENK